MTHASDTDDFEKYQSQDAEDPDAESEAAEKAAEAKKRQGDDEFARMLNESFSKSPKKLSVGDKIRGEILVLGKEDVFVSTGTATDGLLSRRELVDVDGNLTHKVGDTLDLFVTQVRRDEIKVSTQRTGKNVSDDLEDAYAMRLPIEGRVAEVVKGGVRVAIHGKLAFCPISQLDLSRTETGEEFIGRKLEFLITKFTGGGRDIVVSRRKLLEESRGQSEVAFTEERKEGTVVSGTVKRIEPFGAFVEVAPGVEGLLHVSELAWSRVENPADIVKVGDQVVVKVLRTESKEGKLRISLSLKQVGPTPWEALPPELKEGAVVEGTVTRCMKFGAFVELFPGIEGLIPMSEMSYTQRVINSDDLVKEGERVSVKIKDVQPAAKRISLSLRDAGSDPWALAGQNYAVGRIVTGKVERREPYGIFVQLEEGVTGLLPKSKALEDTNFNFDKPRVGDAITVQVAELRQSERRISLAPPGDPHADDWKGFVAQGASAVSGGGLGTLGGALGEQLRKAMEKKSAGNKGK